MQPQGASFSGCEVSHGGRVNRMTRDAIGGLTHTHTNQFNAHFPGESGLVSYSYKSSEVVWPNNSTGYINKVIYIGLS